MVVAEGKFRVVILQVRYLRDDIGKSHGLIEVIEREAMVDASVICIVLPLWL
jgi:hypothetical protein